MSHLTTEKLDATERSEWKKQLNIIDKNKDHFWSIIDAIAIIRKQRLFRQEFKTFEEFVEAKLEGVSLRYTNKLIEAAEARKKLGTIVPEEEAAKFTKPHQLNELVDVPDDKLQEVATKSVEYAGGNSPTANNIRSAKQDVMPETKPAQVVQRQEGNAEWVDVEESAVSSPVAVQDISQAEIEEEQQRLKEARSVQSDSSVGVASPEDQLRALLSRMDAVDALGIVLEAIGPVDDQAMVLAQSYSDLVEALKGLS